MNKNYICNSGANFVTRRKLCLTRLYKFFAEFAWKKSSVLSWEKCFCSEANGRRDVGCLRTALWFFFDTVYRYVLYYSAFERNYWHKWTMIPGYKFPRKKWTTFTMDELREDKALSSPSLKWIKNLALPLPSHHCVDKRLSKNIMDWSHSWVTSLEEEQPSWIGLSIMWGQSFREFSWRFL